MYPTAISQVSEQVVRVGWIICVAVLVVLNHWNSYRMATWAMISATVAGLVAAGGTAGHQSFTVAAGPAPGIPSGLAAADETVADRRGTTLLVGLGDGHPAIGRFIYGQTCPGG